VLQGDAAALPFPNETFSSAIAVLVLHHMRSRELQDRAFTEIFRVLRPGGIFLAFEIPEARTRKAHRQKSTATRENPAIVSRADAVANATGTNVLRMYPTRCNHPLRAGAG
jgi:ubiquinone/menaquinone biosynthesis C-methylase UbiE